MIIIIIINYHSHHNHHHFIINVPVETREQEGSLSKCFDIFLHIANFFFVRGNRMEPNLPENWNNWFSKPIVEAGQANCVQFLKSRLTPKSVRYKITIWLTVVGFLEMRQNTTHPNKRKTTETTLRQYIKINQLYGTKRLSNFQLSVEINPRLQRFSFPSVCDWSSKLAPPSGPIRCKTKANYDLVARVFRSFELFGGFNLKI